MKSLLCLLWFWLGCINALAANQVLRIEHMEFVKSDAEHPPEQGWQAQAMPDSWRVSRPGQTGYGWYRASLEVRQFEPGVSALMISVVSTTYAVYLNGLEIANGGGMQGRIQRNAGEPQLMLIPPYLFKPGINSLHVRLRVAPNLRGGLTPILIGPLAQVKAIYDQEFFWRVTLTRSANVAMIVAGLIVGLFWLKRREQTLYGYFSALAILWSLRNFHHTYTGSAIPSRLWEAFILGSWGIILLLLLLFLLRLTAQKLPRTERALTWFFLAMPTVFFVLGEHSMSQLRTGWYLLCILLGLGNITLLLRHLSQAQARRTAGPWLILAVLCLALIFGLHDFAISLNLLPFASASWSTFGAPILLAAMVYSVAETYFSTFDAVQELNTTLEQRIQERTAQLQQTYERMTQLERSAAIASERERLMRDIHDGVGSQLHTAISGFERGQMSARQATDVLRHCIDDLRLVIDSLDPEQRHIGDALANLKYRMQPKLAAAGLESHWQLSRHPVEMSPGQLLDLVRLIQEALANVLKHAHAKQVRLNFHAEPGTLWQIDIEDDGQGLPDLNAKPDPAQGRGFFNMQRRATLLHATLDIAAPNFSRSGLRLSLRALALPQ